MEFEDDTEPFGGRRFDGRSDYLERKVCNHIAAAMNCSNRISRDCFLKEEVTFLRDNDIITLLAIEGDLINHWDSKKCPATANK